MYHILVVDDEAKIREIIKKYAVFEGYRVTEAALNTQYSRATGSPRPPMAWRPSTCAAPSRSISSSWM